MNTATRKVDRRIQRTHQLLRDALMALIEERGYDPITIQDITDKANVSRTTFYLHFKDKDDLLVTTMEELYDEMVEKMHVPTPDEIMHKGIGVLLDPSDFQHVAEHAKFYRMMIGKHGSANFVMRVEAYLARVSLEKILKPLAERGLTPHLPLEVIAHGVAGLEIGLMRWWLDEDNLTRTPDEMALMMCQLSMFGTSWALGLNVRPEMLSPIPTQNPSSDREFPL